MCNICCFFILVMYGIVLLGILIWVIFLDILLFCISCIVWLCFGNFNLLEVGVLWFRT